mmetsp:Transcript_89824/g.155606  ORF Transcript_89824/g.155606 Transcript_89824/m.155606 type:complete len:119 (-) Transcript_89824:1115-1471(-)
MHVFSCTLSLSDSGLSLLANFGPACSGQLSAFQGASYPFGGRLHNVCWSNAQCVDTPPYNQNQHHTLTIHNRTIHNSICRGCICGIIHPVEGCSLSGMCIVHMHPRQGQMIVIGKHIR